MGTVFNGFSLGGGASGIPVSIYDGLATNGYGITLPYKINADYDVYIDFTVNSYVDNTPVLGNSGGAGYLHLTMFSNKWYASAGNNREVNFGSFATGRHTFQVNATGGYFDGSRVIDFTPTTANYTIYLAQRAGTNNKFNGIIHEFKITSISTGEVICDYVPFTLPGIPMGALYDITSNSYLFTNGSMNGNVVKTIQITELPTCTDMM